MFLLRIQKKKLLYQVVATWKNFFIVSEIINWIIYIELDASYKLVYNLIILLSSEAATACVAYLNQVILWGSYYVNGMLNKYLSLSRMWHYFQDHDAEKSIAIKSIIINL